MKVTIHQSEHASYLGIIEKILQSDVFVILDNSGYRKNYFDNRNKIRTKDGWQYLTVPVHASMNQPLNTVEIDYSQKWQAKYLKSLEQNYKKAPFFANLYYLLTFTLGLKHKTLAELNTDILITTLNYFEYKGKVIRSSKMDLDTSLAGTDLLVAICKQVGATEYLSGTSGRDYLDLKKFEDANIKVSFQEFFHSVYKQTWPGFQVGMSSLDLLFNYGEQAKNILNCKGGECLRLILNTIPDWQNKRILEVFGGLGHESGHLHFYGAEAKHLEAWELYPENCERLRAKYPHITTKSCDSFAELLTIHNSYDIIVIDTPALCSDQSIMENVHRLVRGEAYIIQRAILEPYNDYPGVDQSKAIEYYTELLSRNLNVMEAKEFPREYYFQKHWLSNYFYKVNNV